MLTSLLMGYRLLRSHQKMFRKRLIIIKTQHCVDLFKFDKKSGNILCSELRKL